jgi:DNA-binding beta-propeller fold protein YncE
VGKGVDPVKKHLLFCLLVVLGTISAQADSVLTTIPIGSSSAGVAANFVSNKIYVSTNAGVTVVNGVTNRVSSSIRVSSGTFAIGVNVVTNRVYATSCNFSLVQCNVIVIDGNTDNIVATIPIASGQELGLRAVAVNPVTGRIYVTDTDNQLLDVIDGTTNTIIREVPMPNQVEGVAVDPKTGRIYVGVAGFPGSIAVVDGSTNTIIANIPLTSFPEQIATNFKLNQIYVPIDTNMLSIINGATNQVEASVPTGPFPQGVDVNVQNDKVYAVNANGPSITIVLHKHVIQTLPVPAIFPTRLAVNPVTGFTYVTDSDSNQIVVLKP